MKKVQECNSCDELKQKIRKLESTLKELSLELLMLKQKNTEMSISTSNSKTNQPHMDTSICRSKTTQSECNRTNPKPAVIETIAPNTLHELDDEEINLWIKSKLNIPINSFVLCPSVGHLVKEVEDLELSMQLCNQIEMQNKDYIMAIINNRTSNTQSGSYHWSVLVYNQFQNVAYHLDSLAGLSSSHAKEFGVRLAQFFGNEGAFELKNVECYIQRGTTECGAHVLHNLEIACSLITSNKPLTSSIFTKDFSVHKYYDGLKLLSEHSASAQASLQDTRNNQHTIGSAMETICRVNENPTVIHNCCNETETVKKSSLRTRRQPKLPKKKILILADSHGRHLAPNLSSIWQKSGHDISCIFKPNAIMKEVLSDAKILTKSFTKSDTLVVLGGSNDEVSQAERNYCETIRILLENTTHTNIIISALPYRHHVPGLNNRIWFLNTNIEKLVAQHKHASFLAINKLPRHLYTQHGLHFNKQGKKTIAFMIRDILCPKLQPSLKPKPDSASLKHKVKKKLY
ncbi:uncharacterized protein LOC128998024 [Macrosteles quadrilineatus]|uniref:uncharacterized protein LOC128998024 n=1 Tax=Macrosteles quadrilineatus TaxID=74068 RepID=UPI0023E1A997|nr:uncharacterized protein LOC128998024 [Macrosteles quadrilineatus]